GSFGNVGALIDAIEEYVAHNNDNPKPFIWTKTAGEIITKVRRGRVALSANRALFECHTTSGTPNANYRPKAERFNKWGRIESFKPAQAEIYLGPVCVHKSDGHYRVEGPPQKGNNMMAFQDSRRMRGVS
ncbi:MAG TPA: hypothetical protein VMU68_11715, partial [Acidimicrobiales bacterium]|nr:hypothetical protein [Acidimicrobiales bacterium]